MMIHTYKCDRCGATFEPSLNSPKFKVCEYVGDWDYDDVDLCPTCEIDLNLFMKERRSVHDS